jgi:serine O-acetyltransferase
MNMAESQPRVFEASGGVWAQLRVEAMQAAAEEPLLASYLHASILHHDRIEDALSYHLAQKLGHGDLPALQLREVIREAYAVQDAGKAFSEPPRTCKDVYHGISWQESYFHTVWTGP